MVYVAIVLAAMLALALWAVWTLWKWSDRLISRHAEDHVRHRVELDRERCNWAAERILVNAERRRWESERDTFGAERAMWANERDRLLTRIQGWRPPGVTEPVSKTSQPDDRRQEPGPSGYSSAQLLDLGLRENGDEPGFLELETGKLWDSIEDFVEEKRAREEAKR